MHPTHNLLFVHTIDAVCRSCGYCVTGDPQDCIECAKQSAIAKAEQERWLIREGLCHKCKMKKLKAGLEKVIPPIGEQDADSTLFGRRR